MHFESPYAFLLLLLIPLALAWRGRRRRGGAIRFSSTAHAAGTGRSLRQSLAALPSVLRTAALVLLVIALARPQRGLERVRDVTQGIAIEMVVDRSSSMSALSRYHVPRKPVFKCPERVSMTSRIRCRATFSRRGGGATFRQIARA